MGALYFFLPGAGTINDTVLRQAGIVVNLPPSGPERLPGDGPGGAGGLYLAWPGADGRTRLDLALDRACKWISVADAPGSPLVGYHPDNRPGPDDLCQRTLLVGYDVVLGDGKAWHIPAAQHLPRRMKRHDGRWVPGEVVDIYDTFFQAAARFYDAFVATGGSMTAARDGETAVTFTLHDEVGLAAMALGINHPLLTAAAIELLGLITSLNEQDVLLAVIDWPFWVEYVKKNGPKPGTQADGGSPTPGKPSSASGGAE